MLGFCYCFCRFKLFSHILNLHSGEFALVEMKRDLGSVGVKLDRGRNAIRSKAEDWKEDLELTRS